MTAATKKTMVSGTKNGATKTPKHKNPHHPFVVRFLDGDEKNRKLENMKLVPLVDAIKHGWKTTAESLYPKSFLTAIRQQLEIIPVIKKAILPVVQKIAENTDEEEKMMNELSMAIFNSEELTVKLK
jgi:hypothetical protein